MREIPLQRRRPAGPLGADGITARAAHAAINELDTLGRETARGQDLTQFLPETENLDKVLVS
ncbi:hypothetical protein ABZ725_51745 [Streptomyces sp. NPDC006872]|uniref:hypothetical protein n=1 Tax=Streptomyces sp. NPDC006872 TaxID=3155720 RepID=UPI0033CFE117